jgi:glutathione S-transferase
MKPVPPATNVVVTRGRVAHGVSSVAMRTLVGLSYSPWSEKARWALDHRGIDYRSEEYTPMLGELALRVRTGKLRGKISVPVLLDDGKTVFDSMAIARHAEDLAGSRVLFPEGRDAEIEDWNARSEAAMAAGRALLLKVMARDERSQLESLPPFIPRALKSAMRPVAAFGIRYVAKKYASSEPDEKHEATLVSTLDALRAVLRDRKTIFSSGFTYADIAMAMVLQAVRPVADEYLRLGPATRELWTHAVLAAKYPDLLQWRDELYAKTRNKRRKEKNA